MQVGLTLGVSGEAIMPHSFIRQYSWTAMIHETHECCTPQFQLNVLGTIRNM
jgi:hypothetical protein